LWAYPIEFANLKDEATPLLPPLEKPWIWRHMWVEFVVGSLLCFERFFTGNSGFPLSSKTNARTYLNEFLNSLVFRG